MKFIKLFFIIFILFLFLPLYSSKVHFDIKDINKKVLFTLLSEDEKQWLKTAPLVNVGVLQDEPVSYYDDSEDGFAIEILQMIGRATGIKLNFIDISYFKDSDLSDMDILSVAECDIDNNNFVSSESYFSLQYGVYGKKNVSSVYSIESLEGEKIAISKCLQIYKKYKHFNFTLLDNASDAINELRNDTVKIWITDIVTAEYAINKYKINDIELIFSPELYTNLSFDINKKNVHLLSIINKALSILPLETKEKIIAHYTGVDTTGGLVSCKTLMYVFVVLIAIFLGLLGVFFFYTKKLKNVIKKQNEKFKLLSDTSYNWEYWTDSEGNMVFVSSSVEKITGYPSISFNDNPDFILRIIHLEDVVKYKHHLLKTHHSENSSLAESVVLRFIHRNGSVKWLEHFCYPIYDDEGKWIGRRSSNHDITEKIIAEEKVYESEENFRTVLNSIGEAVVVTDYMGFITMFNPAAERMTGYKADEIMGRELESVFTILSQNSGSIISYTLKKLADDSIADYSNESVLVTKNGSKVEISYTVTPIKDRFGNKNGFVFAVKDVTQQNTEKKILNSWFNRLDIASGFMRFGLWEWDCLLNRVDITNQWLEILNISKKSLKNKNYLELWMESIHVSDKDRVFNEFKMLKEGKRAFTRFECKTVFNNQIIWMGVSATVVEKDTHNIPLKIVGFHQDITRKKEHELEIERLSSEIKGS